MGGTDQKATDRKDKPDSGKGDFIPNQDVFMKPRSFVNFGTDGL